MSKANGANGKLTKTGRPSSLTADRRKTALEALAKGYPKKTAAALAGVAYETLRNWQLKDPVFLQECARAQEGAIAEDIDGIREAAEHIYGEDGKLSQRGDWKSRAWLLERMHPGRFAKQESGPTVNVQINLLAMSAELSKAGVISGD